MNFKKIYKEDFPGLLRHINDPPEFLWMNGKLPPKDFKYISIVGSRKSTPYGKEACREIMKGLAGYPVVIVSGLALGIDTIVHETALELGLTTVSFPGSGLSENILYPPSRLNLSRRIVEAGGALFSEFDLNSNAMPWYFPVRNRLMAGVSHLTIIVEAEIKSGSLITARLASGYSRDVGVVPGPIFSPLSEGTNLYLTIGANPIRNSKDILDLLGLNSREVKQKTQMTEDRIWKLGKLEKEIFNILDTPMSKEQIYSKGIAPISALNVALSLLLIEGLITENCGLISKI